MAMLAFLASNPCSGVSMSALKASLDDGQSDCVQVARAVDLLQEAAHVLDGTDLLAARARLQEVIDALEARLSSPGAPGYRREP
jgi:hypothetical protein